MKATKEMKDWFGDGEYDIDLMISCGAVTDEQIVEMYNREVLGLKPHVVSCYRGLCSSQADDYVGMHMSNESCIACDAAWDQAHQENAIRSIGAGGDAARQHP